MTRLSRRTVLRSAGAAGTAAVVGGAGLVAAQSGAGNGTTTGNATGNATSGGATTERSFVRVVHASPNTPAVDVYVDGEPVLQAVEFGTVSQYLALTPGDYSITVSLAGEGIETAVVAARVTVGRARYYTIVAANLLRTLDLVVYEDDDELVPGQAKLRAINLSPDAGNITVRAMDGAFIFGRLQFTQTRQYVTFEPGTYDVEVTNANSTDRLAVARGIELGADTATTAFVLGYADEDRQPDVRVETTQDFPVTGATTPGSTANATTANATTNATGG